MDGKLFLMIDGVQIEDLLEGDYSAYEQELGKTQRMASGRLVEERQGTIWVLQLNIDVLDAETMARLSTALKSTREHEIFFLPSTGGTELATGKFHLAAPATPSLRSWRGGLPEWQGYALTFEEIECHDRA